MTGIDSENRPPAPSAGGAGSEPQLHPHINRGVAYVSLALAVALVIGVLAGAKFFFDRVALQPVSMTELPSPKAGSAECAQLVDALPTSLADHRRAELAEPAPAGAAAWQSSSTERVTLRCGVDAPAQYNEYSPTEEVGGTRWLRVDDATPGSTMTTWYSVDRDPVVAVTSDEAGLNGHDPRAELDLSALPQAQLRPAPAPLSDLASGPAEGCSALMADLPGTVAEGFERLGADRVGAADTAVWVAEGREPIVVRCGVADPENYEPGIQLYQVNDVTWFEDTTLANGTTSATWFALGRGAVVAANLPQAEGNEAVTTLSEAIARSLPER
ncbi:DUF3515 domain-containing protein [Corynebacterium senegalense]|uniref:DUF3515 domain-containing protein n=1 Tax=Corynebacterium senegalense TaxID=2080750 RepID=UPI000E2086A0|nr:DUF3515 domain-containing protein [Corynebacterium senegalense]